MEIKMYPSTKEKLLSEVKKAFDAYDEDKLTNEEFIGYIHHFVSIDDGALGHFSYQADRNEFQVASFAQSRLGKNRSRRLEQILSREIICEEY